MSTPSSSAVRALALEYKSLQEEPVEGFRVKLLNEDNLFEWEVAIFGPPDTLYQGGYFKVSVHNHTFQFRFHFMLCFPFAPYFFVMHFFLRFCLRFFEMPWIGLGRYLCMPVRTCTWTRMCTILWTNVQYRRVYVTDAMT